MSYEKKQERSKFKEAMRQRIREIAASRDLSDEEIMPVLSLKHQRVAEFVDKHGVNFEWQYEGRGRIFEKDPIRLCPNMTGRDLAAVVATMPEPDQHAIRAKARELLQERDQ
jgi:ATP-dependent Clp protease ATP-binding subunit ClpA